MSTKLTHSKTATIVCGGLAIILGLIMFFNPSSAARTITVMVGWVLLITGIVALVSAFSTASVLLSSADLYWGIIGTLLGLFVITNPGFFVTWIFLLLGLFILIAGFNMVFGANARRVMGAPHAGAQFALSILTIVLGIMVMVSPFAMANMTMMICGIALVYSGVVAIGNGMQMPSDKK